MFYCIQMAKSQKFDVTRSLRSLALPECASRPLPVRAKQGPKLRLPWTCTATRLLQMMCCNESEGKHGGFECVNQVEGTRFGQPQCTLSSLARPLMLTALPPLPPLPYDTTGRARNVTCACPARPHGQARTGCNQGSPSLAATRHQLTLAHHYLRTRVRGSAVLVDATDRLHQFAPGYTNQRCTHRSVQPRSAGRRACG